MFGNKRGVIPNLLSRILNSVPNLINSTSMKCLLCDGNLSQRNNVTFMELCNPCISSIPWIKEAKCDTCGRYEICHDCTRRKNTYFQFNRSAVQYSDDMRNWLARYKYRGDEKLLPLLIEMLRFPYEKLAQRVLIFPDKKFDLITYIPLSSERLEERGFNQAEQLAKGLGNLYHIPVLSLLERTHHTGKQSYKTRGQRLDDLHDAFAFDTKGASFEQNIKIGKPITILLIDDVYTTGSTLNQCASVIIKNIPARIYGLTWAR